MTFHIANSVQGILLRNYVFTILKLLNIFGLDNRDDNENEYKFIFTLNKIFQKINQLN